MKKKLVSVLSLMLVLTMLLTACGGGSAPSNAAEPAQDGGSAAAPAAEGDAGAQSTKDTLVVSTPVDPGNLKIDNRTNFTAPFFFSVMEPLILLNKEGGYDLVLAESYELDADNMGVTFHLKKGVKFHNGEEMTASDVMLSAKLVKEGGYGAQSSFIDLEQSSIVDDYTIHFKFDQVFGPWQKGMLYLYIISEKAYNESDPTTFWLSPIGTGPFSIDTWISGDSLTLQRFDDYWNGPAKLKTIVYRFIAESSVALMELETGGVDLAYNISYEEIKNAEKAANPNITIYEQQGALGHYIGMNNSREVLADVRVRKAIAHAVNREALIDGAFDGAATINYGIIGPKNLGYSDKYEGANWPYDYNPEKARELLKEAGYEDNLTLSILVDDTAVRRLISEQLYGMFADVGITLDIQQYDFATVTDMLNNTEDFDLYLRAVEINDGEPWTIISAPPLYNLCRMSVRPVEGYDQWISIVNQIQSEMDIDKRAGLYTQLQESFIEDWMFWCPTAIPKVYMLHSSNFTGFERIVDSLFFHEAYFQ